MVRHTISDDDEPTPEQIADAVYADKPAQGTFADVAAAVRAEYDRDAHDATTGAVLSPTALATKVCADAVGFDVLSSIDFDGNDKVTVEYEPFDSDDPHATPVAIVRIAAYADAHTDRTVRFRDGAGRVDIFVEVDRDDDDE